MKKLNDALNEINDRYIEEAAQSVRLHNTSARTVRNIAVPVASAAAVAGICLGMAKLGFFSGPQGVDLLPASSDSTESTTATTITAPYAENDFQYPIQMSFPEHIPIVQQTQADIEGIVFGSEFPYMLYADEHKAVFTDGIGGVYSFDLASEQITLAIDIADSMALTFSNFPKDFGADSWNGISLFALGDGQLCCSVTADKTPTATGRGETIKEYYSINFDTLTLDILENFELKDYDIYNGLFDMPYEEGYHALSFNAARIGDTEEYVYIRNCTADIDLLTMYDMQLIELRRWSESNTDLSAIAEAMEGGYYPFTDSVGMSAQVGGSYQPEDDSGTELSLMADGTFSFMPEWFSSYWPHGTYEVVGDIIKLSSYYDGYMWMYRIVGDDLVPLGMARDSAADPSEALVRAVDKTLYYRSAEQQADDLQQSEQYESQQARLAEYLSMLCRGSDFDGEYIAPYFVNMLDGEWFVSTLYGYDSWRGGMHYGIDIVADMGDPIYAAAGGVARVPDVGNDMFGGNGNTVVIQHDGGYFTVYAHTDAIHVQDGERVEQGQHIADVGSTGWSTGPHLHFAVYEGQTPMDPLTWVWFDNEVFTTDSAAYKIKQAFEENQPKTSKPEDLWYPIDTSYEFTMCPDYGNLEVSFNGLQGVSINAMADGEVIYVSGMKYAEGSMIYIAQTDGFVAQYRMVDECIVKVGDHVKAGLKIGQVGEWLEFRIRISDSYTSTLDPDDIVFSTRCLEDDVCGYPTAEDMSDMTPPVSSDKGQIVEMIYGRGGYYEHNGIDIAAEYGTPVYAAKSGEVIVAEWGEGGYGFHVKMLHDDGMVTLYAHLSEINVSKGDRIDAGAQLGAVGSTGYTTGNALHFEVLINDAPVDPTEYLTDYPISSDCFVF